MNRARCLATALVVVTPACHRPGASAKPADAATQHDTLSPEFGPAHPWGDGSVPVSTARGPQADTTRRTLDAVRAAVGFWRVDHSAHGQCPTLADLEHDRSSGFDPATMRMDAWQRDVTIECMGTWVRVRSVGPDGRADTPDDLFAH